MSDETSSPATDAGTTETAEVNNTEATVENSEGEAVNETSYLNGKFKSVSDLEKSYTELQSAFTKKTQEYAEKVATSGAPESYALDENIEMTPRLEALMSKGIEIGLNETAFKELIAADAEASQKAQEAYIAEQKEALGKEADARLKNVADWLDANAGDNAEALKSSMTSASAIQGMEAIIKQLQGTAPAQVSAQPSVDRDSLRAMRFAKDEFGARRMSSDPQYRAKVEALEAEFISNGGKL